jgi:hypothetical protein
VALNTITLTLDIQQSIIKIEKRSGFGEIQTKREKHEMEYQENSY